jgi:phosphoribosyl-ATP pyrophosphohydrolase/phosphoribosyl-AMP cyclohydrolase
MVQEIIGKLKFDEKGLIPAVVQDYNTKEILMVAYMNEESLKVTLQTGRATFFSRSRQKLWTKGEQSGNFMYVQDIRIDCDGDTLVVLANPAGPACHTGNRSCFYQRIENGEVIPMEQEERTSQDILSRLTAVTQDRKANPKDGSYTNYLFDKGEDKILKKVGEEAAEVVIAGKNRDKNEIKYEAADLLYHMTVMLVDNDMTWDDIYEELEKRR